MDAALATPGIVSLSVDRTFFSTIADRNRTSIFGTGWSTTWDTSLTVDTAGNVGISSGGDFRYYVLQPSGSYSNTAGVYGVLTKSGGVYKFTDTNGTENVYLANGLLSYEQDTNGNRITLGYDAQNRLATLTYSSMTDPAQPTSQITLTYNAQGLVSEEADATGDKWTYAYDTSGHLLSVTAPGSLTTSYTYDTGTNAKTAGALVSVTYVNGSQQNFTYESVTGRLASVSRHGGANLLTFSYPGDGEVVASDGEGHQATVWYNDLGLAARVQNAQREQHFRLRQERESDRRHWPVGRYISV